MHAAEERLGGGTVVVAPTDPAGYLQAVPRSFKARDGLLGVAAVSARASATSDGCRRKTLGSGSA